MGDSTSSMLIFFGIIIVVYIIAAGIYTLVEKLRRRRDKGK